MSDPQDERMALADELDAEASWNSDETLGYFTRRHMKEILAALRAQPERAAEEMSVEQIARVMCRHQIDINRINWNSRKAMSAESLQRSEDAGWQQWEGFAKAVALAIRALPPSEKGDDND